MFEYNAQARHEQWTLITSIDAYSSHVCCYVIYSKNQVRHKWKSHPRGSGNLFGSSHRNWLRFNSNLCWDDYDANGIENCANDERKGHRWIQSSLVISISGMTVKIFGQSWNVQCIESRYECWSNGGKTQRVDLSQLSMVNNSKETNESVLFISKKMMLRLTCWSISEVKSPCATHSILKKRWIFVWLFIQISIDTVF